jgi:S-DNA-T family DNA segregation ATPase FtsK/SpoIIIE
MDGASLSATRGIEASLFDPPDQPIAPAPRPTERTAERDGGSKVRLTRAAPVKKAPPKQERLPLPDAHWRLPPLELLRAAPPRGEVGPSAEALQANARLLETVLADYGVQGRIVEIRPGPVVTLYELEPAPGIRSARVIGLADDIARSLSALAVRIATVQGRNVIGIEVPNAKRETVFLSELMEVAEWDNHSGKLALALGKDIGGIPVIGDLSRMPHLLIAGTTGSGKSVGINAMILSLLYRLSPEECRLILIDPKMLELSVYEGIPHLLAPVVTEPAKAVAALKWVVREMERRYRSMSQLSVRNIAGYNERVNEALARGEVVTRRVQTGFDEETGRPILEDQPIALQALPLIVVIDQSARQAGLGATLAGSTPNGAGELSVQLQHAPFDRMIGWLARLRERDGIEVSAARIEAAGAPGMVNASLDLKRT